MYLAFNTLHPPSIGDMCHSIYNALKYPMIPHGHMYLQIRVIFCIHLLLELWKVCELRETIKAWRICVRIHFLKYPSKQSQSTNSDYQRKCQNFYKISTFKIHVYP